MAIKREPALARVFQDGLRLVFGGLIVFAVLVMVASRLPAHSWRDVLAVVTLGLLTELSAIFVLRLLVPRPVPGSHRVGANLPYVGYLASEALGELLLHPVVRGPFWFLHATRFVYLRVAGMEVAWSASLSSETVMRDPSLVQIAAGAQVDPGVVFETAQHGAGRVQVDPIVVGAGVLIGPGAILMPGAAVGEDARVGAGAFLGPGVRVGLGARVGERAVVAEKVDLGSYSSVGAGSVLSEGVKVGDRAKLRAGSIISAGAQIGEREIWSPDEAVRRRMLTAPARGGSTDLVRIPRAVLDSSEPTVPPVAGPGPLAATDPAAAARAAPVPEAAPAPETAPVAVPETAPVAVPETAPVAVPETAPVAVPETVTAPDASPPSAPPAESPSPASALAPPSDEQR